MDILKQMGYRALQMKKQKSAVVLASEGEDGKVFIMAAITPDLNEKGAQAGRLVSVLGKILGGGGGGQPDLATAGGRFPEKIDEAFDAAAAWLNEQLT